MRIRWRSLPGCLTGRPVTLSPRNCASSALRLLPNSPSTTGLLADEAGMGPTFQAAQPVQLVRRVLDIDGKAVGVSAAGRGVPLVMVHGFGVESLLYAQTLGRLVALGFKVFAIDIPGHGESDGLHLSAALDEFVQVIDATISQLGVQRAVFVGHSLGGRIAAELAALQPKRALALMLLDPIVGQPWDELRKWLRWFPPALLAYGAIAVVDVASTLPTLADRSQALKIGSRVRGSIASIVREPWNGLNVGSAVLRSGSSVAALERIRIAKVPTFVVHATKDLLVPKRAADDTSQRTHATFVAVDGAGHSWMVRDPEALPAIVQQLLEGTLGDALRNAGVAPELERDVVMRACIAPRDAEDLLLPLDVVLPTVRQPARLKFTVS